MLLVRERAPLRHSFEIESPSGRRTRWGIDEPLPDNVPNSARWSSTIPGGFESLDVTLPRNPSRDCSDLEELETIRVRAPGGAIVGEYRLQGAPLTSGDQMAISPQAVGWQAHLDDDQSAVMVYVGQDISAWGDMPFNRKVAQATGGNDFASISFTTDAPSGLICALPNQALGARAITEAWYIAPPGVLIAKAYYKGTDTSLPAGWEAPLFADAADDAAATSDINSITLDNTLRSVTFANARRYVFVRQFANGTASTPAAGANRRFVALAVYSNHGITLRDPGNGTPFGVYASDVVAHAIGRWAPKLAYTTGPGGTIDPFSTFVIPHLAFTDPTTASDIVKQASRFDLPDWAVWEGPTFYWNERGARGKSWRARVGPAQLQETGPSIDRLWNSVVVRYQDVTGANRTVGPPNSGADATDAQLVDTDPENPANKAGVTRRALLSMGTTTSAGAIQVGARFLAYQKVISNAGQARLVGHVEDDRGVLWPVSRVRAGDGIIFPDAHNPTTERRIVRAEYTDDDKSCAIDLDAPPDALDALLERLAVELVPLGA